MNQLPKYLDLLLILNEKTTTKIIKHKLKRNKDYVCRGLNYLQDKGMINLIIDNKNNRRYVISLNNKGRNAQKIVILLFNKFR
jgi:DNA-binding MarR family transcriptional regulator